MNDKKYKSISEVSKLLHIKKHVIRYWDSKFDGLSTRFNKKQRYFNHDNIQRLKILNQKGKNNTSLKIANNSLKKTLNTNSIKKLDDNLIHKIYFKKEDIVKLKLIIQNLKKIINKY